MADQPRKICSVADAMTIAEKLRYYFFRGHSRVYGNLTPGVFREGAVAGLESASQLQRAEANAAIQFQRKAGSVSNGPLPTNPMDWLILMQHNGVPTRLLDWSESPLVALFFAVSQDEKVDGELWAMFPPSLNTASIGEPVELPKPSNNFLKFLAYEGVGWNSFAALDRLGMSRTPMGPIAFEPPYTHPRMTAQLSTFTIHPNPILRVLQYGMPSVPKRYTTPQKQKTITESLLSERELVRYEIPAGAKQRIKEGLRCVGITDRTLFMDLDSLGREIRLELASGVFVEPVSPPAPSNENARSVTTDANETERVEERGTNDAS